MQSAKIEQYKRQILVAYPHLILVDIQITDGQFSDVLLIDESLVFRFPKTSHVAAEMAREIPILQALQGKLPLSIPNVQYIARDESDNLIFMGYPMIGGEPLLHPKFATISDEKILDQIASELANFLKTLHQIKPESLGLELTPTDAKAEWMQMYADFKEKLFPHMRSDARETVSANFETALNNTALWDFEPIVCHGDFGTGNILYADGHITGIIDFTFCDLGDPAQEIGALLASYGDDFGVYILNHYPALEAAVPRARFIMSNYALIQALYALRDDNQADFDDGMRDYI